MRLCSGFIASVGLTFVAASFGLAMAAPVTYKIDSDHTYPSFEADHMGISVWRGKMTKSSGTVSYDKETGRGNVDITIDPASIDFGQTQLNHWAVGKEFLDVQHYGSATYRGDFDAIVGGVPTQVVGELTLHGVTRPMVLQIHSLKCITHPLFRREVCGADASGSFSRDEFGLDMGKTLGFKMDVALRIQVEALAQP